MSIRADVRYQTDIVVNEEERFERVIRRFNSKSAPILYELRKRRRDGPKASDRRRNKQMFVPQNRCCTMCSGKRLCVPWRSDGSRPRKPK